MGTTRGIFGTPLDTSKDAVERIDPSVARALSTSALGSSPDWAAGAARLARFDWDDEGRVTCDVELGALATIDATRLPFAALLDTLGVLCQVLRGAHALGQAHGDLGPETVRITSEGKLVLLRPARSVPAGALLAARMGSGASPAGVAFAAPEVATAFEATPASDVYAVAALAHRLATGQPPLGQLDFRDAAQGAMSPLASAIQRSLAASPHARPSIEALEGELRKAADDARAFAAVPAVRQPYRDAGAARAVPLVPAGSPAEVAARTAAASNVSAILTLLLVVGGTFVFAGAVWLVAVNWEALGQAGRFALLALVTGAILGGAQVAERSGYGRSGGALMVLGAELLWADGAYVLDITDHVGQWGAWAALGLAMTGVAFALGWARRSPAFGALAAAHFAVFTFCLGEVLKSDTKTGPALYALGVALAYALVAVVGHKARGAVLGAPFAVGACIVGWVSALAGLVLVFDDDWLVFGAAWPYAVAAVAVGLALVAPVGYRSAAAWVTAGGVLAVAPTVAALAQHERFAPLAVAVATGFALVVVAFRFGPIARESSRQTATALIGITNATVPTTLLFLGGCTSADGLAMLSGPHGRNMVALVVVSALLVGSSYVFGKSAVKKEAYRVLELAGLSQLFGAFTFASAIRYDDWFYPAVCVSVGAVVLALGVGTRRATLAVLASVALVANLSIQYFAKLRDAVPLSLLVLGFGVVLLVGGVLYERRVRHLLPRLREWA